jgi:hypothetical protein
MSIDFQGHICDVCNICRGRLGIFPLQGHIYMSQKENQHTSSFLCMFSLTIVNSILSFGLQMRKHLLINNFIFSGTCVKGKLKLERESKPEEQILTDMKVFKICETSRLGACQSLACNV